MTPGQLHVDQAPRPCRGLHLTLDPVVEADQQTRADDRERRRDESGDPEGGVERPAREPAREDGDQEHRDRDEPEPVAVGVLAAGRHDERSAVIDVGFDHVAAQRRLAGDEDVVADRDAGLVVAVAAGAVGVEAEELLEEAPRIVDLELLAQQRPVADRRVFEGDADRPGVVDQLEVRSPAGLGVDRLPDLVGRSFALGVGAGLDAFLGEFVAPDHARDAGLMGDRRRRVPGPALHLVAAGVDRGGGNSLEVGVDPPAAIRPPGEQQRGDGDDEPAHGRDPRWRWSVLRRGRRSRASRPAHTTGSRSRWRSRRARRPPSG